MKVAIIDGSFKKSCIKINEQLTKTLGKLGHQVEYLKVSEMKMAYCQGCWSCWVKTPGKCIHDDDTPLLLKKIINSHIVIHLTERSLGTITSLSKKTLDKSIPLIHPYIEVFQGKCHHVQRYERYPKHALIFIDEKRSKKHFNLAVKYFERASTNLEEQLAFSDLFTGEEVSIDESNFTKWFT